MKRYIKDLAPGDTILLPSGKTLAQVERVSTGTGLTRVTYVSGGSRWEFTYASLTEVTLPFN